jgi:hypothetical protein
MGLIRDSSLATILDKALAAAEHIREFTFKRSIRECIALA